MHKPVSSVYGKIKRMLLTFPHLKALPNDIVLQRYQGIFKKLTNVEYLILAHSDVHSAIEKTFERCLPNHKENLHLIETFPDPERNFKLVKAFDNYFGYVTNILGHVGGNVYVCQLDSAWHTEWAQDGYCCIKKDDRTVLLEPKVFKRSGDRHVADQVSAAFPDIEVGASKYYIEGGNILAGDDYILIGKDYLHLNQQETKEDESTLTNEFKKLFGVKHVIWLGLDEPVDFSIKVYQGMYQPLFHIDMYITLAGKSENGKELVFVADAKSAKEIIRKKSPDEPFPPNEIIEAFNKTASWLANYKKDDLEFEVKRIPIDLWKYKDGQQKFLTYNNCLVEVFKDNNEDRKNVYLPRYSSPAPGSINRCALDEEVAKIFRENGFNVSQLEGAYEELCKRGGSLHCITKVLDRD